MSVSVLTQLPEQLVNPVWQDTAHVPALHTWPGLQAAPHLPQWEMSVSVLTQVPEQLVNPVWQDTVHLPDEQTCPAAQVVPQEPQL